MAGDGTADKQLSDSISDDFAKAETLSIPITLLILVVAFGALVAAGIPLILAISAVMATIGLVSIPSQIFPVDDAIGSVILLIGMAVGVDYSLFYLRREREERARGRSPRDAIDAAAATSGRAVLDLRPHGDRRDVRNVPRAATACSSPSGSGRCWWSRSRCWAR